MHLLVVSGTNVAIVIIAIGFLLRKFGQRISFAGSLIALLFFVLMTGADAPILRAALMGGITGLAIAWGKMSDARNLVLLSAVIIGLAQPLVLQNDIGFALSFGATLGIIIGFPIFEKIFRGIFSYPPDKGELEGVLQIKKAGKTLYSIFAISLSAQIAILPILMKSFGMFPIGGIPANLFSEPLMPFIMFFSFISSLAGSFSIMIAKIIAIPAYLLIDFLLQIAHFFGQISPIIIPNILNQIFAGIILLIISYGLFSRDFEERFLILEEKQP
jgi:competence protein ComEC